MSDELRMVYNRIVSELDNVTKNRMQVTDTTSKEYIMLTGRIQGLQQAKEAIEAVYRRINMKNETYAPQSVNDLYDILTERQEQVRKNEAGICKEEACSPDYIKGYLIGLQYAKIMTACTEGFQL